MGFPHISAWGYVIVSKVMIYYSNELYSTRTMYLRDQTWFTIQSPHGIFGSSILGNFSCRNFWDIFTDTYDIIIYALNTRFISLCRYGMNSSFRYISYFIAFFFSHLASTLINSLGQYYSPLNYFTHIRTHIHSLCSLFCSSLFSYYHIFILWILHIINILSLIYLGK